MKELIKITEKEGQQLVDARELHEFLGNKRQFADWIKLRINQYCLLKMKILVFHKFVKKVVDLEQIILLQ